MKLLEFPVFLSLLSASRFCDSSPLLPNSNDYLRTAEVGDSQTPINLGHNQAPSNQPSTTEPPDYSQTIPSWDTTHLLARRLLALSSTGTLATVFQNDDSSSSAALGGLPVALPDYIADCANDEDSPLPAIVGAGNPVILALDLSTNVRNAKAGSNISLSIDWWHHHRHRDHHHLAENDKPAERQDPFASQAALPRLSLIGTLEALPDTMPDGTRGPLEECFLASHPDSIFWLPGNPESPHTGYWARLVVHKALWIGGFGDRARIGWLDIDAWKAVRKNGKKDGERGWADVRLPGEK